MLSVVRIPAQQDFSSDLNTKAISNVCFHATTTHFPKQGSLHFQIQAQF